jgi:Ca2+-binding RTX toxin-like protein
MATRIRRAGVAVALALLMATALVGAAWADRIVGGDGPQRLLGTDGQDTIYGLRGWDFISGGPGEVMAHPGR